jgi:triosephosphate isomerase
MHKTASESKALAEDILSELKDWNEGDVVLGVPFTSLHVVGPILESQGVIELGAQNLHQAAQGAFTGEISAGMLRDLFVRYVIIGHSERRQYFGESNALINQKIKTALASTLKPIVCYGETLTERESNQWKSVLETQLKGGLSGFTEAEMETVILAYEPVWAIGTGKTASPAQAQEAHAFSRQILTQLFGKTVADKTRIQYGGSVKPDNAQELLQQEDIDGALVGGASLEARSFATIVKKGCQALS